MAASVEDYLFPTLCNANKAQEYIRRRTNSGNLGFKTGAGVYDWSKIDVAEFRQRASQPYLRFFNWSLPKKKKNEFARRKLQARQRPLSNVGRGASAPLQGGTAEGNATAAALGFDRDGRSYPQPLRYSKRTLIDEIETGVRGGSVVRYCRNS